MFLSQFVNSRRLKWMTQVCFHAKNYIYQDTCVKHFSKYFSPAAIVPTGVRPLFKEVEKIGAWKCLPVSRIY